MKIWLLVTGLDFGGTERRLLDLAAGLQECGFEVVVSYLTGNGALVEEYARRGIRVVPFLMRGKWDLFVVRRMVRFIHAEGIDLVHTHLVHANILGCMAARLAGRIPVISSEVNTTDWTQRNVLVRALARWCHRQVEVVTVISSAVRDTVVGRAHLDPRRITMIRPGVDLSLHVKTGPEMTREAKRELGFEPDRPIVGTVARFDPRKGLVTLICAADLVLKRYPDALFLIVGDGRTRGDIEREINRLRLERSVRLLGSRNDVFALLRAFDIFVLPSHAEGLSISVLEAMATGKPVIATSVGGLVESVVAGETGLLVDPGDEVALSQAIIDLLNDPARRSAFGTRGRERVEKTFNPTAYVRETEQLYREVLRGGGDGFGSPRLVRLEREAVST